jgi:hypothetical protein
MQAVLSLSNAIQLANMYVAVYAACVLTENKPDNEGFWFRGPLEYAPKHVLGMLYTPKEVHGMHYTY